MRTTRSLPHPLLITALLTLGFLAWVWLLSGQIRQLQYTLTYAACLLAGLFVLLRFVFFSSLSLGRRLAPLAVLALALVLLVSTVRYRGVTGDWIPVVEWRWADSPDWSAASAGGSIQPTKEDIDLSSPVAFPQFLGPRGNSVVSGLDLARDWQSDPPERIWQRRIGGGWSGFAIAGGVAYTIEQRDQNETVVAYELATGEEIWTHSDVAYFSNPMAGPGPRTTPSVGRDLLFTVGSTGILNALDRTNGELAWRHDIVVENGARIPEHGVTGSPLLVDGLVVVSAGGPSGHSLVAYDQSSGEVAWHGGDDAAAFGSPQLAELAGVAQILVFNRASVAGHSPADGRVLWQHPWPSLFPNVATPAVVGGDRVMFSTGYGIGAKMLRISKLDERHQAAELLWESPRMKAKFTNLVVYEGFIYGLDDGVLVCLDPDTGERRWKRGRYGHGNILLVGDVLLVQTEKGEMVMIDPNPDEHREITRFLALKGKAWNHFALVDPYLLVRNDREAALWRLPLLRHRSRLPILQNPLHRSVRHPFLLDQHLAAVIDVGGADPVDFGGASPILELYRLPAS